MSVRGRGMKIAILSMQRIVNFGSVLQAYSLREMVREITGETAVFLDIESEPALAVKRSVSESADRYADPSCGKWNIYQRGKRWRIRRLSRKNKSLIRSFMRDELHLDETDADQMYDCVIVGSDEVFNHAAGVRLQLHGEVKQAKRVISYAASCGCANADDIALGDTPRVKRALENFSAISVRDEGTKAYVEALCGKNTVHHLDPVLMGPLHKRKVKKVALKPYLLVYAYGQRIHTQEEISAIRAFAKKKGLLTVAVGGSQFWCDMYIPASPFRVLDYFSAAQYVVTDTFHGVIFSVLAHRKFGAISRRSNENKMLGLLTDLGLKDRLVTDITCLSNTIDAEIDYQRVDSVLQHERARARAYLREQLLEKSGRILLGMDEEHCSGCGACAAVCPKHAVSMRGNEHGYMRPVIDDDACIRCGKCVRLCESIHAGEKNAPQEAYAAVGSCESLVRNSASGGMFASLAMSWIRNGGLVAGAVMDCMDTGVRVYHLLSDKEEDIRRMQGSKYVQSDAWMCYDAVHAALRTGREVLFSGTPCQAAAIKQLTGNPENLTTIDLVCHGVPPAAMLEEYIRILEKRLLGKTRSFSFRDKRLKKKYCAAIEVGKNRKVYMKASELSFYQHFLSGVLQRESCYACPYACLERSADVTIGDYWGIDKAHEAQFRSGEMPRRNDWSCLLVNSDKGARLLKCCGGEVRRYPTQAEWIAEKNNQLVRPSEKPANRERMLELYKHGGYAAIDDAYIKDAGGKLRYSLRLIRNQYRNRKAIAKGAGHED